MAECIEREALIKKLRIMPIPKQAGSANTWLDNCAAGVNAAIREVASFPAAEVAPVVHGKWDKNGNCTNCGKHAPFWSMSSCYYESPYCQSCGAMMDGGTE